MRSGRSGWRRAAAFLFVAAAFFFLGLLVVENVGELRNHEWDVRPGLLALSVALNITGLAWGVFVWRSVLRRMGSEVRYLSVARVWFLSGLGRYIPGKIWQFVGAAHLGGGVGIPASTTVTALAVHTGFFILGAVFLAAYLVPASLAGIVGPGIAALRWLAPLLLAFAHPAVIRFAARLVSRVAPAATGLVWRAGWLDGIVLTLYSAVGWLLSGIGFHLFVISLTPLPAGALPGMIGINALSFVAGYLVVIAPAGLGAKEIALAALLPASAPAPVAALLAAAARLWSIASEVLPAVVFAVADRCGSGRGGTAGAPGISP